MKSYTDLVQSKKLAEILPIESADMKWYFWKSEIDAPKLPTIGYSKDAAENYKSTECVYLPCWSLAALLSVLNKSAYFTNKNEAGIAELSSIKTTKWCVSILNCGKIKNCYADNPVDACYEMVVKLNVL